MAINQLQLPGAFQSPTADFTPLANLGKVYKNAQDERTISDVGKGLADGSMDYKTAAGQIAGTGNLGATYQFLQLAEAKDKQKRETEAGNIFASQLGGIFSGGNAAGGPPSAPPSDVIPQPASSPLPLTRAPVVSSPKVWGDSEAVNAGLYDPPSPARPAQPPTLAAVGTAYAPAPSPNSPAGGAIPAMDSSNPNTVMPGPSAQRIPTQQAAAPLPQIAAPAPSDDGGGDSPAPTTMPAPAPRAGKPAAPELGAQHIPMLLGAMSNPNLPAGQRETAKLLLTEAFKNAKDPEKIQVLKAMQADPSLLATETALRNASKTQVSVDTSGGTAFAKAAGGAMAKRFEDLSKEGDTATNDLAMVGQLRDLGQVVKTGAPAAIQGWLADRGIKVGDNVGAVEAYGSIIDKLTPTQRVPGSGSTSDYEGRMFKNSLPKLLNTPEGNAIIENTLAGLAQSKIERAKIADQGLAGELKPGEAVKLLRALPSPYENFKAFAKNGFKADPNNPQSVTPPNAATRPSDPNAARIVPSTKVEIDQSLANARAAVQRNPAARADIVKKLRDNGLDTSGL